MPPLPERTYLVVRIPRAWAVVLAALLLAGICTAVVHAGAADADVKEASCGAVLW